MADKPPTPDSGFFTEEFSKDLQTILAVPPDQRGQPHQPGEPSVVPASTPSVPPGEAKSPADVAREVADKPATSPAPAPPTPPPNKPTTTSAPAAEPDDDAAEPIPKDAAAWKSYKAKYKAELNRIKQQADKLTSDLENAKKTGTPPDMVEFQKTKEERDKLLAEVRAVALERDPEFVQHYDVAQKAVIDRVLKSVPADKQTEFRAWLTQPDSEVRTAKLEELVDGLSALRQSKIASALDELDRLNGERAYKIEQARSNWELNQRARTETERREKEQQLAKVMSDLDMTAKRLRDEWEPVKFREGDDAWNRGSDEILNGAREAFKSTIPPQDQFEILVKAASLPRILTYLDAIAKENATLKERLKSSVEATPAPAPGGAIPAEPAENEDIPLSERIARQAKNEGFLVR